MTVELLEKEFQAQVLELARLLQWRVYHTHDSRRSQHGFPDLVLLRDRLVMVELKRDTAKTTVQQRAWLAALWSAGVEVYLVRPRNLDALARILSARPLTLTDVKQVAEARGELERELDKELRMPG